ncbi:conserved hypothetical protein, partial [Ricinus communis]
GYENNKKFKVKCLHEHVENHLKTVKNERATISTLQAKNGFRWDDTATKYVYDEQMMVSILN